MEAQARWNAVSESKVNFLKHHKHLVKVAVSLRAYMNLNFAVTGTVIHGTQMAKIIPRQRKRNQVCNQAHRLFHGRMRLSKHTVRCPVRRLVFLKVQHGMGRNGCLEARMVMDLARQQFLLSQEQVAWDVTLGVWGLDLLVVAALIALA